MNKRCQKQNLKAFEKYHQHIEVNKEQPKIGVINEYVLTLNKMVTIPNITANVVRTGHHFTSWIIPLMEVEA